MASKAMQRLRRFAAAYGWLVRDHVSSHKAATAWILTLSAIGAVSQGLVLAFIGFAIDRLQNPRPVAVPVIGRWLSDSPAALLALTCVGLLVLAAVGALSVYRATIKARAQARALHFGCGRRALRVLARRTSLGSGSFPATQSECARLIQRDPSHLGNAFEVLIKLAEPLFRLVVSAVILFWIDWKLTLLVAPALLLLLPVVYRLHHSVQEQSRRFFGESAPRFFPRLGGLVRRLTQQNLRDPAIETRLIERQFESDETIRRYFDDYDHIQLAGARVQFAMSLMSSVFLVLAIVGGGYFVTVSGLSWGLVLTYVLALWHVIGSLRTVQSLATSLSVFYPAIVRYMEFVGDTPTTGSSGVRLATSRVTSIPLTPTAELAGSATSFELRPGEPAVLITDQPLDRLGLARLIEALRSASSVRADAWAAETVFLGPWAELAEGSLRETLLGGEANGAREAALRGLLVAAGVDGEFDQALGSLDAELTAPRLQAVGDPLKMALLVAPLLFDDRRIVLIDLRILRRAQQAVAEQMLKMLGDRLVLVVADGSHLPGWLSLPVVVARNGRLAGAGPMAWYRQVDGDRAAAGPEMGPEPADEFELEM